MQRNSWYQGGGQWGRDSHDRGSAIIGFDAQADLFVWWYPDSSEGDAPWSTPAWRSRAKLHLGGSARGRLDVIRSSAETTVPGSAFLAKHRTSGDMADGFAAGYLFAIEDSAEVEQLIAAIYALRDGADNTGQLGFHVASDGTLNSRMTLSAAGLLTLADISLSSPSSIYGLNHDGFSGFVANEHKDTTAWSASLIPDADRVRNLGDATHYWQYAYIARAYHEGIYLDRSGNDPYIVFRRDGSGLAQIRGITAGVEITDAGALATWLTVTSSGIDVAGEVRGQTLRIDQTPTSETPSATHTVTINCNGTDYKLLCLQA